MIIIKKMLFNKTCVPIFDPLYPPFGMYPHFQEKVICDPFFKNDRTPIKTEGGGGGNYEVPYQPYSQVHNNQRMSD